ncbi:MAG TPA: type II toxin-antitoxin system HicB family antitoxin [Gemmataceae bacterium]|nr:type II toxin-antitoxin system HicB family antitoxin [Gemmataceae bacterium]
MKVRVLIQPEAEGGYSAFVPGFPGCTSSGETLEETLANIREAFEGVFEVIQEEDPEAGFGRGELSTATIRETIDV